MLQYLSSNPSDCNEEKIVFNEVLRQLLKARPFPKSAKPKPG